MRTSLLARGISLSYPDEHCYIFNPVPLIITGLPHGEKCIIKVDGTSANAYSWEGVVTFDMSKILQSKFSARELSLLDLSTLVTNSKAAKIIPYSVTIGSTTAQCQSLCVWGALQVDYGQLLSGDFNYDHSSDFLVGELISGTQNVVWFEGLPCSISVPMVGGDQIVVGGEVIHRANTGSLVNLSLAVLAQTKSITGDFSVQLKSVIGVLKRQYNIIRRCSPNSRMYLRWIDKKGYYCYWAFEKGSDAFDTGKIGAFINTSSRQIDYVDGFNGGDGRQQGKSAQRTITIVEPLCDISTWNYLLSITQSPIVDLYTDNDYLGRPRYIKVDVVAGKIARDSKELADFVSSIVLPDLSNQSL